MCSWGNSAIATLLLGCLTVGNAVAQSDHLFGLRGQVGLGYPWGPVYGGSLTYTTAHETYTIELGLGVLSGNLTKKYSAFAPRDDGGFNKYEQVTDFVAVGFGVNFLLNYSPEKTDGFYVFGAKVGSIKVDWEESSVTDYTVGGPNGEPLPGGGSIQARSGSGYDLTISAGKGAWLSENLDVRFLVSGIFIIDAVGYAPGLVPVISVNVGYMF